ncbi:MAG: autotransporter-associated beta strand repeat-containing protein, partial [Patescibacteria group bacterium]|nr:autotransporter-associated beta strand repeat-containing protein [Patescibacteria group bacterium]
MCRNAWLLIGCMSLASVGFATAVEAAIIADYQTDYVPGSADQTRVQARADGWDYMWNSTAAIGTATANYSSLVSTGSVYNFDGGSPLPRAYPAYYVYLSSGGGHPGPGVDQSGAASIDRFAIAAYTVQPGEAGLLQLSNSGISVASSDSNGVELRVYVNDTLVRSFIRPGGGASSSFDAVLGWLDAGDRVYVAVGPNRADSSDGFGMTYRIETASDAAIAAWDANGSAVGSGGTGTWTTDAGDTSWAMASGYGPWDNAANRNAYFGGEAGTVTVANPVSVRSMTFYSHGYTVDGTAAITLTSAGSGGPAGAAIEVANAGATATITTPVVCADALAKLGAGVLRLEGTNTISVYLNVAGGDLVLAGNSATSVGTRVRVGWNGVTGGGAGRLVVADNASLATPYLFAGDADGVSGAIVQTGGTITVSNRVGVGHYPNQTSTYTMSGGSLILTGSSTTNPFGTAEQSGTLYLGIDGTGVFTQSGGSVSAQGLVLDNRGNTTGTDTYTLTGGVITLGMWGIQGNASTQINLGGGAVAASADWGSSMPMTLTGTNGLTTIDTNGHTITLSGNLTGAGGLLKTDTGTLVLTGTNSYTGETRIDGGTLTLRDNGTITTSLLRNRAGGVTLNVQNNASIVASSIVFGDQSNATITINQSGGLVRSTGTTDSPAGNNLSNRWGHWGGSTTVYNLSGGTLDLLGAPLYLSWDGPATLNLQGGTANILGINMGYGGRGQASTINLTSGRLNLGAAGVVTGGTSNKAINLGGGTLGALANWSSSLPMALTGLDGNTTVDTSSFTIALSGVLSGVGGLNKIGDGTLQLTGTSTYTGPTTVTAGTLRIDGSIASNVAVNGVLG